MFKYYLSLLVLLFCIFFVCTGWVSAKEGSGVELVEVSKIWDKGAHNAFTDLIRFEGKWYCTFREADRHAGGEDGKIRVISSKDGQKWESAALLAEEGVDLRDPKLSITADGRCMLVMGGSIYEGTKLVGRQPRVSFSKDGVKWTQPQKVLSDGEWLWRLTWYKGKAYGVSYSAGDEKGWSLKLFVSEDGLKYREICMLEVPGRANETTLRFTDDGRMVAFVRREGGSRNAFIGVSEAPYTEWVWKETSHQVGGPNFIILPDGEMWGGGRNYPGGAKTAIGKLTLDGYEPLLTLPSGGDTSYPGMVWYEDMLWVSYYSSHEGKSSIYLAKIRLANDVKELKETNNTCCESGKADIKDG